MASSKEFVNFILDQCDCLTARAMMGDYVVYYRGKVVGGIYDNRLLVRPTESAKSILPNAEYQIPYDGAKPMIYVEDVENRELLNDLFETVFKYLYL